MLTDMITPSIINEYIRHLKEDLHRSSSTVRGYREELELLLARRVPLEPKALAAYVTHQEDGTPLAANTRNRRLTIVRGFCAYLIEHHGLEADPTRNIQRAKVPFITRSALGVPEVNAVLEALEASETSELVRVRDRAVLLLLFYTGLRVSELVRLKVSQVDLASSCLRAAHRKGGDQTDMVLHPTAQEALVAWLAVREGGPGCEALFPGGNTASGNLTTRAVQKRLQELGGRAGLAVSLHPHALRHAHATELLRANVNLELVRMSMNHKRVSTTQRYLHADIGLLRPAIARLPRLGRSPPGE